MKLQSLQHKYCTSRSNCKLCKTQLNEVKFCKDVHLHKELDVKDYITLHNMSQIPALQDVSSTRAWCNFSTLNFILRK